MGPIAITLADVGVLVCYALLIMAPGLLVGTAAGLRGWTSAAVAPLLTYAVAGLSGPWSTALGLPWNPLVLVVATLLAAGVLVAIRRGEWRRGPVAPGAALPPWSRTEQIGTIAAVALAVLVGATVVLRGVRRLATIPQDWDAVFHANGIRWIADTGDAGLFAMSRVNWYEDGGIFYPNAYHLVAATVYQVTGREIPDVLNAHTALIPGLIALVLVGMVRRFGGSGFLAAGTALAVVGVGPMYDMLWRGPLLPYATGVAVTPAILVMLTAYLDAGSSRQRWATGLVLALGAAGLACLHPAMLFGAVLLVVSVLAWRWVRYPARLRSEPVLLVPAGLAALALSFAQLRGALVSASGFPPMDWAADLTYSESVWALLTFSHGSGLVQVWFVVPAAVGLATYHRLGDLRWIGLPLAAFGVLFVLTSSSDAPWVNAITRPWWNDRWRLVGVFAVLLCVLIGHGLAQVGWAAAGLLRRVPAVRARVRPRLLTGSVAALVLIGFVVASRTLYLDRNAERMSYNTGEGPAISSGEIAGLRHLGTIVAPDSRVLNDRQDGSVWMYALAGVRPVAGHYDGTGLAADHDSYVLAQRFNQYESDAEVRAAVDRLDVRYVVVGEGFLRGNSERSPGLRDLDGAPYLTAVYRTPEMVIYELDDPVADVRRPA